MNADQRSTARRTATALVAAGTCVALLLSLPAAPDAAARGHAAPSAAARTTTGEAGSTTGDAGITTGDAGITTGDAGFTDEKAGSTTGRTGKGASGSRHPCASATARCDGEIRVPLDWGDPASERITVTFAWLPRKDASRPASGTVLANPGGPLAALPAVPSLAEDLGPVLDRHNLLVVEPRGLGGPGALLCPGLDLALPETVRACAAHLGPRGRFFTADQAVTDMNAVRDALGVPKVTFYGISYGTLFAQAYATRHPGTLSGVLLDSVVPTGADGYVAGRVRKRVDLLDVACAPSRACRRLPGEPSAAFPALVRRLRAHPDPQIRLSSLARLPDFMHMPLAGREAGAAVAAYLDGDPLPLRRLVRVIDGAQGQPMRAAELAGLLSYVCADSAFPFERSAPADERRRQMDRHYEEERPFRPFTLAEVGGLPAGYQDICVDWPTPRTGPPVPPGAGYPRVPVLTLNGDFDGTTPAEAAAVTRRFPDSTFSRVRSGGHSVTAGTRVNGCARAAMRAFLADPAAFDDRPRCDEANYRALGSFPETVERVPPARAAGLDAGERRILAAAFATAADAVARRNPVRSPFWMPAAQEGLRGGRLTFDDEAGTVRLRDVRFVGDLTVNGEVRLSTDATARLTVTGGGGSHTVEMSWKAFLAGDDTAVSGTFAGRGFTATIPVH
ncbi:alpha/beta hydrolase [Streptosporangium sp. NPDC048865]|uniref:alpha/beta hydrolase n=1 Tax=Streptosporangium sp. NPDC048865 TaxID=3155766 RepID=UPI003423910A